MAKVADGSTVGRVALARDPGLRVPEDAFRLPLADLLKLAGQGLRLAAKTTKEKEEEEAAKPSGLTETSAAGNALAETFGEAETPPPLPPRKPEPPEETARRLHHGAATTARRARAAEGRLEMTRAAQAVLAAPDTPAAELPGRVKTEAGKVLKDGVVKARQAGLSEDELARLEADLGAQELLLLEQGLAEQAMRMQAQTEAQLEAEAGGLIEAVRRDPGLTSSAEPALAELLADFAPGFREGALEGLDTALRRRLAAAEIEGLLARGDLAGSEAALARAPDLPGAVRRDLDRQIAAQRARQPREDQALAAAFTADLIADVEAGRPADLLRLREIAVLGGPEALEGLEGELERAAERRRVALRLATLPQQSWAEALREEGLDPTGLDLVPNGPEAARDPRLARATQLAQAGGAEGGDFGGRPADTAS